MMLLRYLIIRAAGRDGGTVRLTARLPRLKPNEFAFALEIMMPLSFWTRTFKHRLDVPKDLTDKVPTLTYVLRDQAGRFVSKDKRDANG